MPFVDDADLHDFEDEPIPVIGSDLLRGLEDDEEPLDSGPTVIEKFEEELPGSDVQLGDAPADEANDGNDVEDQETEEDEDIPNAPEDLSDTSSAKKSGRASIEASRGSTPKTPKSAKAVASTAGRKRKAETSNEEPPTKRPGRGRATAAAASVAIKEATAKRPRAAPGTKAPKAAGVKRGPKPGSKFKKAVKEESAEEYEVEEIKDHKTHPKGKGLVFLVKWKGYEEEDSTWEPKENLAHCADLLKKYKAAQEKNGEAKEEKAAPARKAVKKAAGSVKNKTKVEAKKVAPTKKAATAKPAAGRRGRSGRPKRN